MNPKIAKLLIEGFSINTLENLSESQINSLYRKLNEQKGSVKMKTGSTPEQIKQYTDKGVNVEIGEEEEVTERAVSKKQQRAMAMALKAKQGEMPKSKLKGSSKEMFKMSEKDLEDFASTKHKGLPNEVKKSDIKKLEENIMKLIENYLPPRTTKGDLINMIRK
jgi:tRNA G10  N-methylase Trm11